jgi:hypothetical protein
MNPRRFIGCLLLVLIAGCTSMGSRHPVPEGLVDQASVPGLPRVRAIVDVAHVRLSQMDQLLGNAAARARRDHQPVTMLALSGGGPQGAYGAGLLCGWTKTGSRPEFDVVVGISTGSLIGPYAFLGPAYDEQLKQGYTTVTDKDIFKKRHLISVLFGADSVASSAPLAKLIAREMDPDIIEAVAAEYRKGRRFYVGTSDLDAQRLVVWDMGAIAASGQPGSHELFCKVLLASASIPVAFPPVRFEVQAHGQIYDELHADGGVMTQVFGAALLDRLMVLSGTHQGKFYLIRNECISPEWQPVKPRVLSIASHSMGTVIKMQGLGDVYRLYLVTQLAGIDFNFASIPDSFDMKKKGEFDPRYMKALFAVGYHEATNGTAWKTTPPSYKVINDK